MRIFGIETEYGFQIEDRGVVNQIDDAANFISHCPILGFSGWDYSSESPRNDIRGFQVKNLSHDPVDAQFDEGKTRTFDRETHNDKILINGARFYNDHGHPEYATPECGRIIDLLAHDAAGEKILLATAKKFFESTGHRAKIYKNNTDFHGASYGTHENYSLPRSVTPDNLISGLLPFLICRQILFGAGKVGSETGGTCKFQLSQRADFLHEIANIETLYRRPIFNTRDEPHADNEKWQRVHVICGDANRMPWATAMKIGTTRLVLDLIELGACPKWKIENPVRVMQQMSKDSSLIWRVPLEENSWTTAPEILIEYLTMSKKLLEGNSKETDWILNEWDIAMSDLSLDVEVLADRCDWVAKQKILKEFEESEGEWIQDTMQSLDLEYANLDPDEGLFSVLENQGLIRNLIPDSRVIDAMTVPPPTRASHRSQIVATQSSELESIGWKRAKFKNGSIVNLEETLDKTNEMDVECL